MGKLVLAVAALGAVVAFVAPAEAAVHDAGAACAVAHDGVVVPGTTTVVPGFGVLACRVPAGPTGQSRTVAIPPPDAACVSGAGCEDSRALVCVSGDGCNRDDSAIVCVAGTGCNDGDATVCVAQNGCNGEDAPVCVAVTGCNSIILPDVNAVACPVLLTVDWRAGTNLAEVWGDCEAYNPIL